MNREVHVRFGWGLKGRFLGSTYFKIFCRDYVTAKKTMCATKLWLAENLHLQTSDEKSGITNLRKNYTTFLGIKFKVVPKGKRWIVRSHMADKSKEKAIHRIRGLWNDIKNPGKQAELEKNITLYNSVVMGMHNYYCMAMMVSAECFLKIHNLQLPSPSPPAARLPPYFQSLLNS